MSTELATTGATSALAISAGQEFWNDKQLAALRQLGLEDIPNGDLAVFWHQCVRTGLDPFARQIYLIERQGKPTIQTGIDGFRLIARRAVDRAGETLGYADTMWCGADGQWVDVWLPREPPAAAKVTVLRAGQPYPAIALFSEYAATKRDGSLTAMWASKPALMLAKCCEALALRKAFPQDLSGIYTTDEMQQSENPDVVQGTVVRDETASVSPPPSGGLDAALAGVAVAGTVDLLRAVWDQHAPTLSTPEKAKLHAAMLDAKARIEAGVDADGVVDGDVVEGEVVDDAPPSDDGLTRPASRGQLQRLSITFEACGLTSKPADRDDILAVCSAFAHRAIRTRNELTGGEAADIEAGLKRCLDSADPVEAFTALVDEAHATAAGLAA